MTAPKTIEVLGLGATLKNYQPSKNITIGVNDIWKKVSTDYVVCVDLPRVFSRARQLDIMLSNPAGFYSSRIEWKDKVKNFRFMELASGSGFLKELDSDKFCWSNNSTYAATVLAFKLGANKIILHGVDFNNHHAFSKPKNQEKALKDFKNLHDALKSRGVRLYVGSRESKLSEVLPVHLSEAY